MGSEAQQKTLTSQIRRFKILLSLVVAMVVFGAILQLSSSSTFLFPESGKIVELNFTKFRECTISFKPPKVQSEWKTKPIWLPAYPTSIYEATHKSIIKQLTGLDQGGKSFYASARRSGLRQCFGKTETATCSNVHPMVEMAGGPGKKVDTFYPEYIMAIRNPMTAIPSFVNEKQIKYHGGTGQMAVEEWRKIRDEHIGHLIDEWKNFVASWKKDRSYQMGMYIVHEDLYDIDKGPAVLERLRGILQTAGFIVAPKEDLPCILFNAIGEDKLQQHHTKNYDYDDYIPGYTKEQKRLLLNAVLSLSDEFKEDKELVSILQKYANAIEHIHIEKDAELWTTITASHNITT